MNFKIIKAREEHRKDISRLLRTTRIGSFGKHERIKNFWVVKMNDRIVACAGLDFFDKEIAIFTHLAVEKEFRHQGIGSALIRLRMDKAKKRGAKILAFVTMYYWFRFYKKRGFRTCPRKNLSENIKNYWMFTAKRYMKCAVMYQYM